MDLGARSEPILRSEAAADLPALSEASIRSAVAIKVLQGADSPADRKPRLLREKRCALADEEQLGNRCSGEDIVLLKKDGHARIPATDGPVQRCRSRVLVGCHLKKGTIWFEMAPPSICRQIRRIGASQSIALTHQENAE